MLRVSVMALAICCLRCRLEIHLPAMVPSMLTCPTQLSMLIAASLLKLFQACAGCQHGPACQQWYLQC